MSAAWAILDSRRPLAPDTAWLALAVCILRPRPTTLEQSMALIAPDPERDIKSSDRSVTRQMREYRRSTGASYRDLSFAYGVAASAAEKRLKRLEA